MTWMPSPPLGKGTEPVRSVPMVLPWIRVSFVPTSRRMPFWVLPEMTLRDPGVVPPMVLWLLERLMPLPELPRNVSALGSVPM